MGALIEQVTPTGFESDLNSGVVYKQATPTGVKAAGRPLEGRLLRSFRSEIHSNINDHYAQPANIQN